MSLVNRKLIVCTMLNGNCTQERKEQGLQKKSLQCTYMAFLSKDLKLLYCKLIQLLSQLVSLIVNNEHGKNTYTFSGISGSISNSGSKNSS